MNLVHWYSMHLPSRNFLYQFYCIQYTVCVSLHHDFHPSGIEISRSTSTSQHLGRTQIPSNCATSDIFIGNFTTSSPCGSLWPDGSATLNQPQGTSMQSSVAFDMWKIHDNGEAVHGLINYNWSIYGGGSGAGGYRDISECISKFVIHESTSWRLPSQPDMLLASGKHKRLWFLRGWTKLDTDATYWIFVWAFRISVRPPAPGLRPATRHMTWDKHCESSRTPTWRNTVQYNLSFNVA